jgi:hypothetical protein
MKITALMLAVPLVLGANFAFAQSTSTTQRTVSTPLGSVETRTTTDHSAPADRGDEKTVEKTRTTTENPDGSVTTRHTRTVNRPD